VIEVLHPALGDSFIAGHFQRHFLPLGRGRADREAAPLRVRSPNSPRRLVGTAGHQFTEPVLFDRTGYFA
jgi:hypothetical protein